MVEYCKRPKVTPAWSLTTLTDMLPSAIEMNGHFFCLNIGRLADDVSWYISYVHEGWTANIVKGLTLTLTGDNLWLWSKYIGYDPDVSTESDGSVMRRVDIGAYPKARMVILKANIKF